MRLGGAGDLVRRLLLAATVAALVAPVAAVPASAAGGVDVTLTGTVRMTISDDFEHGRSTTGYLLETDAGRVPLVVDGGGAPELSGRRARVTGTRLADGRVRVSAMTQVSGVTGAASAPATADVAAWPGPAVRKVAVVLGRYTDAPVAKATPTEAQTAMQGTGASVRTFFETASRGRVSTATTVLGPWNLGISSCPSSTSFPRTIDAVVAQAAAHGVNLATFDHVIMWTEAPCGSGWVALGEAPGTFVHVGVPYPDDPASRDHEFAAVVSHEMGHNMGLLHANALACQSVIEVPLPLDTAARCRTLEYGDPFSAMGGDLGYQDPLLGYQFLSPLFDTAELAHLGWLDATEEQTVTAAGTYALVPAYAATPGVRLLRIRRTQPVVATDPSSGWSLRGGWLTIELRSAPPAGPWDAFPASAPVRLGVVIRYVEDGYDFSNWGYGPDLGSTYLVDMAPASVGTESDHTQVVDAPLGVGQTFTDPVKGTQVTLTSLGAGGASVAVAFPSGNPPAAPALGAPTITSVVPDNGRVTVAWDAPPTAGTHAPDGYTARSFPGGATCSTPATTCTVEGLANGVTYRFVVSYGTGNGFWASSAPSDPVAPLSPPTAAISGLNPYRTTPTFQVAWTGADHGGPVDSFDVQYRSAPWNGTFGGYTAWKSHTTAGAALIDGTSGRTYCFSVLSRVGSRLGTWSPEVCTAVPLDDRSLTRGSGWTALTGTQYYRSTVLRASAAGSSLTRTGVVAKRAALLVSTCPTCGSVKVYWDGVYQRTISLVSATARNRVLMTAVSFSAVRTGTLKLVVGSSSKLVRVDGVAISRR